MSIQDEKLTIDSLTGGARQENGAFEELMRAVKSHLVTEHDAGRITGDNYTQAYIASLGSAMNTAASYILQAEITNQQVRLLDEQILAAAKQVILTQSQIDKIAEDILLVQAQVLKVNADTALTDAQALNQVKAGLLLDQQVLNAQQDILNKQSSVLSDTAKIALTDAQTTNETTKNANIVSSTAKLDAEEAILAQRLKSEEAQTKDLVDALPVGGILGKQMALYSNQADGYLRDAEQKAAKIMNDAFVTRVSTDWDNPSAVNAGISDSDMSGVMTKLVAGI